MNVLDKDLLQRNLESDNAHNVIEVLGKRMRDKGYVKDTYVSAVLEREKVYPTGLPSQEVSVAIPHTDSTHVNQSCIAVGVLKNKVPFRMMGDPEKSLDVEIVFLLAISDPDAQVQFLGKLMGLLSNGDLLLKLKQATSEEELMELLTVLE